MDKRNGYGAAIPFMNMKRGRRTLNCDKAKGRYNIWWDSLCANPVAMLRIVRVERASNSRRDR